MSEYVGPMGHGVELDVVEGDLLHVGIGGVVSDRVPVAAVTVAGVGAVWLR